MTRQSTPGEAREIRHRRDARLIGGVMGGEMGTAWAIDWDSPFSSRRSGLCVVVGIVRVGARPDVIGQRQVALVGDAAVGVGPVGGRSSGEGRFERCGIPAVARGVG